MFAPDQLAAQIKNALATNAAIPPDHRGALVTAVDQYGVHVAIAERLTDAPDAWTVTAYVNRPNSGQIETGVSLQKTW